jgi:hypothetical protein
MTGTSLFSYFAQFTPIAFTVFIFLLVTHLDRSISDEANAILRKITGPKMPDINMIRFIAIDLFDTLYGTPLFSLRSFLVSAIMTIIITPLVVYHLYYMTFYFMNCEQCGVGFNFYTIMIANIFSDYLSLFAIRRFLRSRISPYISMLLGPLVGALIILSIYTFVDVFRYSWETGTFHPFYFIEGAQWWLSVLSRFSLTSMTVIFLGAFVVQLWLPLVAIIAGIAKLFIVILTPTQWLIKDGYDRPLKAMSYVGAFIAFWISLCAQWLWGKT